MKTDRAKQIIVEILQKSLIGQLNLSSNFKPQFVADAIADKVNFEKSYTDTKHEILIKAIRNAKNEMEVELEKTSNNETLLKNFIRGKLTAYDEILNTLTK